MWVVHLDPAFYRGLRTQTNAHVQITESNFTSPNIVTGRLLRMIFRHVLLAVGTRGFPTGSRPEQLQIAHPNVLQLREGILFYG